MASCFLYTHSAMYTFMEVINANLLILNSYFFSVLLDNPAINRTAGKGGGHIL